VVEILGDLRDQRVLEVGAGTGKWTRLLIELGALVTVVEPDDDMRAVLERRSPDVTSVRGTAEALPLADASYDVVLVSSAWHWFEQPDATNEMARVMRDGGALFVLWNGFSRDVAWLTPLIELRDRPEDDGKRPRGWAADLGIGGPFDVEADVELDWTWTRSVDEMIALFCTFSGAIIRSDAERLEMERELRQGFDAVAVDGVLEMPMTVRGTVARRRARD